MSFKQACENVKGIPAEKNGVKVCKIGGERVNTIFYNPEKEKMVIEDHSGRETEIEKVDEVDSGTLWMIVETPEGNAVIANPNGEEPTFDNYIEG